MFPFFSDSDSEFHGVDFLPEDLSEAPEGTGMRVNKKYSCLPAEEKGIHIINIRAIEDIGYDQHESTVSDHGLLGQNRLAALHSQLIPHLSHSQDALESFPSIFPRCWEGLPPGAVRADVLRVVLGCVRKGTWFNLQCKKGLTLLGVRNLATRLCQPLHLLASAEKNRRECLKFHAKAVVNIGNIKLIFSSIQ